MDDLTNEVKLPRVCGPTRWNCEFLLHRSWAHLGVYAASEAHKLTHDYAEKLLMEKFIV